MDNLTNKADNRDMNLLLVRNNDICVGIKNVLGFLRICLNLFLTVSLTILFNRYFGTSFV